ncbi:MAG TPA: PPOX class F420-dependent oxidoreductase [Nocardioidaceae bacterium]|nr:PPOX class F420-dependent oxidoreductase [Nocardioidaceae bacterium]
MSSGRSAVRMSEDEIADFLVSTDKVQVATIGPDGAPHLTTLFYFVQDGKVAFWTYASSQKIKNLQRDPRITLLIEDGDDYFELRGVTIFGKAELVTDEDGIRAIGTAVADVMAKGQDMGDFGREMIEKQVKKRWGVVVTPTKVASWDHRKMLNPS